MLRELSVQNLALIEDVRVELQPGFCAWTGETGAGKSLLLGALSLLLGERGSAELIRTGAEELRIVGRFELTPTGLREEVERILNSTLDDDEVILARRLTRAGRSYAYVNDVPVAVSTLKSLGSLLVDIHGQRESESLLEPSYQLLILDAYGGLTDLRQAYVKVAEQVRHGRRQYHDLLAEREHRQRELNLVRFERDELDAAEIQPNELAELQQERDRLANVQNLQAFAEQANAILSEDDGSVVEQLGKLQRNGEHWAHADKELTDLVGRLESVTSEVREIAHSLRRLGEHWEADPERLAEIEERVMFLKKLETKYRRSLDGLIAYRQTLDDQEAKLQQQEDDLAGLEIELIRLTKQLQERAAELTKARQKVAKKLAAQTQKHLADLSMADARLDAVLETVPLSDDPLAGEVPVFGADALEFMLAANRGEPARPLRKVASGGELSRTMLALKSVLAGHDEIGTLIFDEIDANVGARLGDVLGQKLAALGRTHQVICVTHLAQVASYARNHWTIRKMRRGSRTVTQIAALEEEERLEELASMMRGESRTETTRQEVAAMLEAGRRCW
jgi:DNA repair protein RecN (Recombination protein N)